MESVFIAGFQVEGSGLQANSIKGKFWFLLPRKLIVNGAS